MHVNASWEEIMHNEKNIKVWDPFVRLFHWILVLAFGIAYISEEDFLDLHTVAGYVVIGLLVLRLVWGLIGSRHARFIDFTYPPRRIIDYLRQLATGKPAYYVGHNPAGGAMILLLIATLMLTTFTGLLVYAAADHAGPLAGMLTNSPGWLADILEETHEFAANLTLFLVLLHLAGVIVESALQRENLIRAMITGDKPARQTNGELPS
jgi:cytochrome b